MGGTVKAFAIVACAERKVVGEDMSEDGKPG